MPESKTSSVGKGISMEGEVVISLTANLTNLRLVDLSHLVKGLEMLEARDEIDSKGEFSERVFEDELQELLAHVRRIRDRMENSIRLVAREMT